MQQEHAKGLFISQNNKVYDYQTWQTHFLEVHEVCKGLWAWCWLAVQENFDHMVQVCINLIVVLFYRHSATSGFASETGPNNHQVLRGFFNQGLEVSGRAVWHWKVWQWLLPHLLSWRMERCETQRSQTELVLWLVIGARKTRKGSHNIR